MTTSGTSSFTVTRDDIILSAALKIGVVPTGQSMDADTNTRFAQALNAMVKRWQASGLHVWTTAEGILFPQPSQVGYSIGTGATDNVTSAYSQTATTAAAAAAATTISVASTANIADADNIGFLLNGGSLQWTTVSSKTSTSVTIPGGGLTDSVASGAYVFNYTSKIVRPLKIVAARRLDIASGIETRIWCDARLDYLALPNKTQNGMINRIFYDPQLGQGVVYLWNPIAVIDTLLKFTWHRPIQDFDAAGDNPDLPQEWVDTLIFQLAMVMAPEYSVPMDKYQQVKEMATSFLDDMQAFDRENESLFFGVDNEGYGR